MISIVDLFISWILLSYVVSTHTVLDRRELNENGYECGDAFFNDQMIYNELKTALSDEGRKKLIPYSGPLYRSILSYTTLPILPIVSSSRSSEFLRQKVTYQLVIDQNGKVIDMIFLLTNNQFVKCRRVDKQQSEALITNVVESNGYECGPEFIPDSTITESARIARKYIGKNYYYPTKYRGNLYSNDLRYKIWPIYYKTLVLLENLIKKRTSSLYIVIDSTGQLKDVIARTSKNNHIRCMRARKASPAPNADEPRKTLAKPTKYGYTCRNKFIDFDYLRQITQKAVTQANKELIIPRYHTGAPFYRACYLVPLKISLEGHHVDKYFLVLSINFGIMGVAMQFERKLESCEKDHIPIDHKDRNIFLYSPDDF
ncbi:hypothetical protein EPUL_006760 [Erysiphe pulchra]|uniref:Uncharacterized protein n=1 Tax=Erysiphe pulchra TaxID=225359 RepID=A0A2S4PNM7_9PEZI|nr:hypothetical protein EPUL_006760 [Erysiphe pulchra]